MSGPQTFGAYNLRKQGVQVLLFPTEAAYHTAFPAAPVPALTAWSITQFDSNNNPIVIAVFEKNGNNVALTSGPGTVAHYAVREAGRALDTALGYITKLGIVTFPYPNITTAGKEFDSTVQADWKTINATAECGTSGSIFYGQTDPLRPGTYICGGSNGTGDCECSKSNGIQPL
jgi:hypothetical protein